MINNSNLCYIKLVIFTCVKGCKASEEYHLLHTVVFLPDTQDKEMSSELLILR